jgi:hypothetical protein
MRRRELKGIIGDVSGCGKYEEKCWVDHMVR